MKITFNSNQLRQETIKFSCDTKAGHLAPSLSTIEILAILFNNYLEYNPLNAKDENRDRLIFSKGHGCYAYYLILNQIGFIPDSEISNFNTNQSTLKGCLIENPNYMIEASTGSLGHGLPLAVGMAKSFKIQNKSNKVICIVGDGEMQEGSNYEALHLAHQFKLDNLMIIVDANGLQAMDFVEDVSMKNTQLAQILKGFSPNCFYEIDGHDENKLKAVYENFYTNDNDNLSIIVAHTTKGNGLELIENKTKYHYRCPTEDGYKYIEEKVK